MNAQLYSWRLQHSLLINWENKWAENQYGHRCPEYKLINLINIYKILHLKDQYTHSTQMHMEVSLK